MQKPSSRTLPALIEEMAARYPDRPALSYQDQTLTFAQFRRQVIDFAKALHADGVRPGDKVGILMGNRTEWLTVNFAIQYLGATMVAMNTWYTSRELAYVLEHGDVTVLVTADRFLKTDYVELVRGLQTAPDASYPHLRQVVLLGEAPTPDGWAGYDAYVARGAGVPDAVVEQACAAVAETDVAYILYTSGSTSRPKGVMLLHQGLLDNGFSIGERLHLDQEDCLFLPVSLFWGLGCENAVPAAWTHGAHIVLQHRFDAGEAVALIEHYRCSVTYGTANITHLIFEHPDAAQRDLGCLRKGMVGGAPDAIRHIIDTYMPMGCHAYGLTETYGYATITDAFDPVDKRVDSFGRPTSGNTIRIHDPETGDILPAGQMGEVRQRGLIMAGYYKSPDLTAEAYDQDGFFKTGDLGYLDDEGYFYFRGRLKEMLKTGGMNVSPAEVEDVLRLHPKIADAFVTGLADPVRDQVVAALIIAAPGVQITDEEILAHCRELLAAFKTPRRLRRVRYEDLPFTSTGKVHRMRLPELFAD